MPSMDEPSARSADDIALTVRPAGTGAGARVVVRVGEDESVVLAPVEAVQLAGRLVRAAEEAMPHRPDALTPAEFRQMVRVLHRYAETELDQWDTFSVPTTYGPVYLLVTRVVADPDLYSSLDGFLADPDVPPDTTDDRGH